MNMWIARPLLPVSKVSIGYVSLIGLELNSCYVQARILATCEENGLPYSVDKTNFQPDLTFRNAIRSALSATSDSVSGSSLHC